MSDGVYISFPGLGIDEFKINSVAFDPFGIEIRWYAIIICTGIILAFLYFFNRAKRTEGLLEDDVLNVTLIAVPLAIVGARFLYVITNLDSYDSFFEMINIRFIFILIHPFTKIEIKSKDSSHIINIFYEIVFS